ncbi:YEATS domain-containing protein 2 [Coemansia sp. RSA 988]|nr:YEATS domain-containing protein 2 [Coemansia sp. RSA 988]
MVMTPDFISENFRSTPSKRRRLYLDDEQARSRVECIVREQLDVELYLKQNEITTITSRLHRCEALLGVLESAIQAQTPTSASLAADGFKSHLRSLYDASLDSYDLSAQYYESPVRGRPRRAAAAFSIPYPSDHHSTALESSDEGEEEIFEQPTTSRARREGPLRVDTLAKTLNSEQLDCVSGALEFISSRRAPNAGDSSTESESDSWSGPAVATLSRPSTTTKDTFSSAPLLTGAARDSRFHVIRHAILGNTSQYVDPQHRPPGNERCTHRWTVYIRGGTSDASPNEYIRKVRVFLHPSYRPDDIVDLTSPSLELTRWGWGEFPVRIQVFFRDRRNKPVDLIHILRLDNHRSGTEVVGSETPVDFELDRRGLASEPGQAAHVDSCSLELPPTNPLLRQLFQALCSLNPLVLDDAIPLGLQAPTCREQILDMVPSVVVSKWTWGVAVSPDIWHEHWPIGKRLAAENSRNRVLLKLISTALRGLSTELAGRQNGLDSAGAIALTEKVVRALFQCSNLSSVAVVASAADSVVDIVHRSDAATCSETIEMLLFWAVEYKDTRPLCADRTRGFNQKQYAWSFKRWLRANGFVPLPILSTDDLRSCILTQVPVHDGLGVDRISTHHSGAATILSPDPESAAEFGLDGVCTASKSNPERIPRFFCNACGISLSANASGPEMGHHANVDAPCSSQDPPAYCCRECESIGNSKHFTTTRVAEALDALPSGWDHPETECNADALLSIDDDNDGDNDMDKTLVRLGGVSKQTRVQIERFATSFCADSLLRLPVKASIFGSSNIDTGGCNVVDASTSAEGLENSDDSATMWSNVEDDESIDWVWNMVRPLELNCATASRLSIIDTPTDAAAVPSNTTQSDLVRLPNGSDGDFEEALTQHLPVGQLLLNAAKLFLNDLIMTSVKVMRENCSARAPNGRESPTNDGPLMLTPLHILAAVKQNPQVFDVCSNVYLADNN